MRKLLVNVIVPFTLVVGITVSAPAAAFRDGSNRRIATTTEPTAASVQIAQDLAPFDGNYSAVVVARNDNFADNLGGSALAGAVGGPLLLTNGGPTAALRTEVRSEIKRLVDPATTACSDATAQVFILGGTSAVSATAEQTLKSDGWCVRRLGGATRIETAIEVARVVQERATGNGQFTALLARSDNPADAATGGALASRFGNPILVTPSTKLSPAVATYLENEFFGTVRLLGGTAALSAGVDAEAKAISSIAGGTERHAGTSREGTAVSIAEEYLRVEEIDGSGAAGVDVAIVNGYESDSFVYALSVGAMAASENFVVLYVRKDSIPADTCNYLIKHRPRTVVTVGPTSRVSETTKTLAESLAAGTVKSCASTPSPLTPPAILRSFVTLRVSPASDSEIVALLAGDKVQVSIADGGDGTDSYLILQDPNGATVAEDDNSGENPPDAALSFTIKKSGTYNVIYFSNTVPGPAQLTIIIN